MTGHDQCLKVSHQNQSLIGNFPADDILLCFVLWLCYIQIIALINVEEGTAKERQPTCSHLPIPPKQVQSRALALRQQRYPALGQNTRLRWVHEHSAGRDIRDPDEDQHFEAPGQVAGEGRERYFSEGSGWEQLIQKTHLPQIHIIVNKLKKSQSTARSALNRSIEITSPLLSRCISPPLSSLPPAWTLGDTSLGGKRAPLLPTPGVPAYRPSGCSWILSGWLPLPTPRDPTARRSPAQVVHPWSSRWREASEDKCRYMFCVFSFSFSFSSEYFPEYFFGRGRGRLWNRGCL